MKICADFCGFVLFLTIIEIWENSGGFLNNIVLEFQVDILYNYKNKYEFYT